MALLVKLLEGSMDQDFSFNVSWKFLFFPLNEDCVYHLFSTVSEFQKLCETLAKVWRKNHSQALSTLTCTSNIIDPLEIMELDMYFCDEI